jgi:large subunit ribosomal protein L5
MSNLQKKYREEIIPEMMNIFNYKNPFEVPRLKKIVINRGVGRAIQNIKMLEHAQEELAKITGQRPVVSRAKKSIAAFNIRAGMPIGCYVTLRRDKMYHFLDRFINSAIPGIRDFRGLPTKTFDGRGNYTLPVEEQLIFPEISYDDVEFIGGMSISFVTTAETDEEAFELLRLFGMPFRKK